MYKELYAALPDKDAYLERIGLSGAAVEPTLPWLDTLVQAQLTHIPFDDIDVWDRASVPSLAPGDLFDKIILRRRGGYCFELNSLFNSLLRSLGFETYMVTAHVIWNRDFVPPASHCGIICTIDGRAYFCDVGFGGPVPNGAVPLDGELRLGYRLVRDGVFHRVESVREDSSVTPLLLIKNVPALPVELLPLNFFTSQNPDSDFRKTLHLNLRLPDGSVSVQNRMFKQRSGSEHIERRLNSVREVAELLPKYFGIPAEYVPQREFQD